MEECQGSWVRRWPWCGLIHGERAARRGADARFVLQSRQNVIGWGVGTGHRVEGTACTEAWRPPGPRGSDVRPGQPA